MLRPSLTTAAVALLCTGAMAQGDFKSRLHPITSPIQNAGVYHVATGRWTRGATLANGTGPATLYNNTCSGVYYGVITSGDLFQHRSRLPSNDADATPDPTTDSIFYGTTDSNHRYDERAGCSNQYVVNGFDVEYCSSHIGALTWTYQFAHSYTVCGAADMIPNFTITVTGLPGGTSTGAQRCWIVGLDVSNETGSDITLSADGNGTYEGPSTADQFGFSMNVTPAVGADQTGPIVAGNFTWTGLTGSGTAGVQTPCTGTDGTIWDYTGGNGNAGTGPTPAGEVLGTGMSSNDFFRITGPSPQVSAGCYYFGGNPHADFYLKLYGTQPCNPDPLVKFCAGGVGGIITCPCGNAQVPAGATKGCNNFAGGGTGGAILSGSGTASISADTFGTHVTAGVGSNVTVQFQGTTNTVNTRTGAGVRCVGGTLKRLYKGNQAAGAINFPNTTSSFHVRSAAAGFPIVPPVTLYYYCAYRNSAANGQPGCPGLTFGFNSTNAGSVLWTP